ncbi:aminophospholipid-transporting P-ATPase, putative [Plasmodium gallinaceum]|uniref:Phospholipid-transporting ATPase n=1 Tax=Plasmodium gallinaceum TaxID=5849 RepID=A0A1J1GZ88_PLAGA|nr:aminophospholipid-transporting P-ATPase, putative [Plasmodium gallinaceum]CRG97760.1 aminophospholipid-transporting P-ATPase, putative [Plasmodium gallinaceum]
MPIIYRKSLKLFKRNNEGPDEIKININSANKKHCNNSVITSKYTIFNFIFLNIYEQFHKISNVYFFFIGILQAIPQFTATNGIPTVFFPLLIVLIANAIKDAYEDWNRHKTDKIENNRICYVITNDETNVDYNNKKNEKKKSCKLWNFLTRKKKKVRSTESSIDEGAFTEDRSDVNDFMKNYEDSFENIEGTIKKRWKDITVGDIILCRKSEFFCADILLLCTSDKNGIAFVETSSLDGETNLKVKEANGFLFNILSSDRTEAIQKVKQIKGFILSDIPNKDLSTMYGTIYFLKDEKVNVLDNDLNEILQSNTEQIESRKKRISSSDVSKNGSKVSNMNSKTISRTETLKKINTDNYLKIPFDSKQFVLRGCKLKNTDWIIGIVIYTGKETKIQMNSTKPIRKTSKLERLTNRMTIIIWFIQMIICFISAYYNAMIVSSSRKKKFPYLPFNLEKEKTPIVVGVISFFSWIVITGNFVPISLIVTMSFVKVVQAYFISCDKNMIHKVQTDNPFGEQKEISSVKEENSYDLNEKQKNKVTNNLLKISDNQSKQDKNYKSNLLNKDLESSNSLMTNVQKNELSKINKSQEIKEKNYIYFNAVPRTSSLIEELGQIEYIFSDKTGTLTCNIMEFKKCAVNGISYGKGLTEIKKNILKKKNLEIPDEPVMKSKKKTSNVNIVDSNLVDHLHDINHFNHAHLISFFLHLAINHSVICERGKDGVNTYSSSSPDEEALVNAAKHFDITFLYRKDGKYGISIFGKIYEIDTLASIEFTSQRKMSSIICRIPIFSCCNHGNNNDFNSSNNNNNNNNSNTYERVKNYGKAFNEKNIHKRENNDFIIKNDATSNSKLADNNNVSETCNCKNSKKSKIMLFCKGAGSVILKKLAKKTKVDDITIEHMEAYADEGLRTLCIAQRELSEETFAKWYELYKEASLSIKDRERNLEHVASFIENDLILQGVTGIEDKLQEGVSSTIEDLRIAGIHIWMLTGDKIETAMNIGIAANLIDNYSVQYVYTEDYISSENELMKKLDEDILKAEKSLNLPHYDFDDNDDNTKKIFKNNFCKNIFFRKKKNSLSIKPDNYKTLTSSFSHVLVVDGNVIDILLSKKFEKKFFYLADKCTSVICGRVSPYQKGAIVSSANRLLKKITLAIGDGANDRNMINRANIGIGIRGQEGVQAFNSSDYGISQFRFLKNLLLVHGRLSYRRISKLVVYMFYKNIVLIFPLFIFGSLSLYSGQKIYYEFLLQVYNVFFTSIPVIIFAILDQDINLNTALEKPVLYKLGIYHYYFNINTFVSWVMNSLFHGSVVFLIPLYFLSYYNIPSLDGIPYDIWTVGCVTFFLTVLVVNLKILLETYYLNMLPIIAVSLSIFSFLLLVTSFSFMYFGSSHILGTVIYLVRSLRFWLVSLLSLFVALSRDYIFKVYKRNFNPEVYHILQDHEDTQEGTSNFLEQIIPDNFENKTYKNEKSKSLGYAFSEADPACIQLIRKQDKMI